MFTFLRNIFGPGVNYAELLKNGATIIDVRSKGEYNSGHIKGSLNIPLNDLGDALPKHLDKSKAIITCCASGMRSAAAKSVLKDKGYTEVYNGGGWVSLQRQILK